MATDLDFTFTGDRAVEERLNALYDAIPGFDDTSPTDLMAGLLFLDQRTEVYSEKNYILMAPGYAFWFLMEVEIQDFEISSLLKQAQDDEDGLPGLGTTHPFEVSFTRPDAEYPAIVAGKTLRMRIMTEDEESQMNFGCCTMTPDGKVVHLPTN